MHFGPLHFRVVAHRGEMVPAWLRPAEVTACRAPVAVRVLGGFDSPGRACGATIYQNKASQATIAAPPSSSFFFGLHCHTSGPAQKCRPCFVRYQRPVFNVCVTRYLINSPIRCCAYCLLFQTLMLSRLRGAENNIFLAGDNYLIAAVESRIAFKRGIGASASYSDSVGSSG